MLPKMAAADLLALYSDIVEQLRDRNVLRSANNPVADYSELLFCEAFGWERAGRSAKGHDAICKNGFRYQVKGRRPTRGNTSRLVSALRGLEEQRFDTLAGVVFNPDFTVARALLVPHRIVQEHSEYRKDWGWRFSLRDELWALTGVTDVTEKLRAVRIR